MNIYRYWAQEKVKLQFKGETKEITCWGGSYSSEAEARTDALTRASWIQKKAQGLLPKRSEEYEAYIREEIIEEIEPAAVVTRNRYGSKVLNTAKLMFLDIDHAPFSWLKMFSKRDVKKEAVERIEKLASSPKYGNLGFRIYETHKGIRVIVTGENFEAKSAQAQDMMKEFGCDGLYILLCKKQNCFRARLNPKPYRIKMRGMKFIFPYEAGTDNERKSWLAGYEEASKGYSTCRLIKYVGKKNPECAVTKHHDWATDALKSQPLA